MGQSNVDGGRAWLALVASFFIHFMAYGMAWSTGVYYVILLDVFKQPKSVTAWAGTLPTAMIYATGPISSMLTNKYGCRPVIILGGVISSLGLALSYFAPSIYYLFFTFGALAGAGFGITYIPAITAISYYFKKKINVAAGIAASGIGVGNFVYPVFIRFLINTYDWRSSLLILGALSLHLCVFGALIRPTNRPDIQRKNLPIIDITPFKKKGYLMLCFNNFLWCCGISVLYLHLTALAESQGIDSDRSAYLLSALGIANLTGRFSYGFIAHHPRVNIIVLYSVSFCIAGFFVCLAPFCKTFPTLMCASVLFGLFSGCFGTLLVSLLIQILGLRRFANGYGCLLLFEAAGQLIGGPLAGCVFDLTRSYTLSFVLGGILCILSAFAMIQPYFYVKANRTEPELDIPEKEALSSFDFTEIHYPSVMNMSHVAVSLEVLSQHSCDDISNNMKPLNHGSLDVLPVTKRLLELKKCHSTASV